MNSQRNKKRGAAMVEFAILLPLLIVLVFGITELGRALYQQNTLNKAIASGVRYMSRSFNSVDSACSPSSRWGNNETQAKNLVATGSEQGGTPLLPGLTVGDVTFTVEQRSTTETSDICVIRGSVSVDFQSLFGESVVPLLNLGPITLTANSEERHHGS